MNSNNNMAIDPVCGMQVDTKAGKPHHSYKDTDYHFCAQGCHSKFKSDPWFYVKERHIEAANLKTDEEFTCPMDPEVINQGPGTCPVCGMALEPMSGFSDAPNEELIDFSHRMKWSIALALPLLLIAMGPMLGLPLTDWLGGRVQGLHWFELLLATPVVVWFGMPIFQRGWSSIVNRSLNMWTLIMLGVGAAYGYSVIATLFPNLFPQSLLSALGSSSSTGGIPVFFEAAAVIIALVFVGQVMELRAREKTGEAIKSLVDLAPKMARRVLDDDQEYDAPLENILPGDLLRVLPGTSVPVDGEVVDGVSEIDESLLTGESLPAAKQPGDTISAGTVNTMGSLVLRADAVGDKTRLAKIVNLVAAAQRSRSPMQNLADRVAAWFVPGVVLIALSALFGWWLFGPAPSLAFAITAAVSVLIIACPCALGLATPMSVMIASGKGAHNGMLIRDAAALDRLAEVDTIVLDKTGTVTEGRPVVSDVIALGENESNEEDKEKALLRYASLLESRSEHPLARAIQEAANNRFPELASQALQSSETAIENFTAIPGKGVSATVAGETLLLGNAALMGSHGVNLSPASESIDTLESEAKTVMMLARGEQLLGLIAATDQVKTGSKKAIEELRSENLQIIMASGDSQRSVMAAASNLGVETVHSQLLPEDKLILLKQLQNEGRVVAMVGDGINDSPALAQADVGIAMGSGADIAIESAGITLLHSSLDAVVKARRLSIATRKNIKQNLFFAFAYNSLGIPLAAGVLYPLFGWLLSPMFAAAAMAFSSVSVIANALRLRKVSL